MKIFFLSFLIILLILLINLNLVTFYIVFSLLFLFINQGAKDLIIPSFLISIFSLLMTFLLGKAVLNLSFQFLEELDNRFRSKRGR